jgi:hypothetical protein
MVAVFILIIGGFAVALMMGSVIIAVGLLMGGLAMAFVIAIAWMRPGGGAIEHHPKVDRIFDDTAP